MTTPPMRGRVALVTGVTSGIGKVTALALAKRGASLVCVCRDKTRSDAAIAEIKAVSGNTDVQLMLADLSSQSSIRELSAELHRTRPKLHVLVNDAGVVIPERRVTVDGLENTFALNHLGYFLLTRLLLDLLRSSAPARIVNVASEAERMGKIDFDDLQMERGYSPFGAYCRSKLANIMFTYELARRLEGTNVTVNAVHPGPVRTRFGEELGGLWGVAIWLFRPFMRSPEKGAETVIHLASSPDVEGMTGLYWSDRKPMRSIPLSYDEAIQKRLWEVSERLTSGEKPA
jgi:NAD(P)-dependent dehydrogenase (short-subunit alcohol dehydrogenase family)